MTDDRKLKDLFTAAVKSPSSFDSFADFLNDSPSLAPSAALLFKKSIEQCMTRTDYLTNLLDFIEFCSVRVESLPVYFNEKTFLQVVNTIFRDSESEAAKNKVLALVGFLRGHFRDSNLKNFAWYAENIEKRGKELPPFKPSKFETDKKKSTENAQNSLTNKQKTLLAHLKVVEENLALVNDMVDNKQVEASVDALTQLTAFDEKLRKLPEKLGAKEDKFLLKLTQGLIKDSDMTLQRVAALRTKSKVPPFNSEAKKLFEESSKAKNDDFSQVSTVSKASFSEGEKPLKRLNPPPKKGAIAPNQKANQANDSLDLLDIGGVPPVSTQVKVDPPVLGKKADDFSNFGTKEQQKSEKSSFDFDFGAGKKSEQAVSSFQSNFSLNSAVSEPKFQLNSQPNVKIEQKQVNFGHNPTGEIFYSKDDEKNSKQASKSDDDPFSFLDEKIVLNKF